MSMSSKSFNREHDHNGKALMFIDELPQEIQRSAVLKCLDYNAAHLLKIKKEIENEHKERKAIKKADPKSKLKINKRGKSYVNVLASLNRNKKLYALDDQGILEYGLYHLLTFNEKGELYLFMDKKYI